jgi:dolichol-phosphate mannosyltransferase
MRRPLTAFALFVAAYLAVIGWGWFRQTPTPGELPGHAAKIEAIVAMLQSGDYAWFPDYLSGAPSASLLSFALAIPVYAPALWLMPDPVTAMKLTALALLALGGFAAFGFGRRLSGNGWSGFAVGCAWLLAPQLLLRAAMLEHMTILVAIPLVPLAFLALLRVAERGTVFDAILLAATWSAAILAWSKMGATLVLPLAIFAGWLFLTRPECRLNLLRGALWAVPAAILLGVVPLLPLLRERAFMTVFELDPFKGWQMTYSLKAATSWFDRDGVLFASLPKTFRIDPGAYYLGLVGLAAVACTIRLSWRNARQPCEVAIIRLFLFIALFMFWLSFGPRSVLQGHFELLAAAELFPDAGIVLHWLALAAQGVFLFWCVPRFRWRVPVFIALFAVYLLLPAFRIAEHLPLYADLRAPDSFWILNGSFAWAVASALAVAFVLKKLVAPRLIAVASTFVFVAACLDLSGAMVWFYRGGVSPATLVDYREVTEKLRSSSGRVLPLTNSYYTLDLAVTAGRPLSSEALNRYLMPRDMARLQTAARLSATNMLSYFRTAGIGDILLLDDIPEISQKWFRSLLPVSLSKGSFTLLSNPDSLYPGFFAADSVPAAAGLEEYPQALEQATLGRVTIANPDGKPSPVTEAKTASAFQRLSPARPRTNSSISFAAPGRPGWIVLSESWHPDWKATVDGQAVAVSRATGAFPAVPVTATSQTVEFRFSPPGWYAVTLGLTAFSWLAALVYLLISRSLPGRKPAPPATQQAVKMDRTTISRPIALVPTFNEAGSISELIAGILAAHPHIHVLVIDDASPDGTAARVKARPEFGERVFLHSRTSKQGLGSAYREGFRKAIERNYDACIEIDADFSHDPADIPRLIAALDAGADAAIGSRYLDGLRVVNWPRHRLLLSTGASRYVRLLTGLPLTDATSGFKALRTSALEAIDWSLLQADGYGFQIELHWLFWKAGLRIVEVPIVFTERRVGATKMTAGIAVEAAWRMLQLAVIDTPRRLET